MIKFNIGDYCQFKDFNQQRFWIVGVGTKDRVMVQNLHFYKHKNKRSLYFRGVFLVSKSNVEKVIKYKRLKKSY